MYTQNLAFNLGGSISCKRCIIDYLDSDVAGAAATTLTKKLFNLPKGSVVIGVRIKHSTAFAGTNITAMTVSVGSATNGNTAYSGPAFDIFQAVGDGQRQLNGDFIDGPNADEVINAYFTATGGNLNALTAGSVSIDVFYLNCTEPSSNV